MLVPETGCIFLWDSDSGLFHLTCLHEHFVETLELFDRSVYTVTTVIAFHVKTTQSIFQTLIT